MGSGPRIASKFLARNTVFCPCASPVANVGSLTGWGAWAEQVDTLQRASTTAGKKFFIGWGGRGQERVGKLGGGQPGLAKIFWIQKIGKSRENFQPLDFKIVPVRTGQFPGLGIPVSRTGLCIHSCAAVC
jgi:hypothetical protein